MSFWSNVGDWIATGTWNAGDPDGFVVDIEPSETRALPNVLPSPWDGWPAEWGVPNWDFGSRLNELVDVAWMCLDRNASALSTMPVYKTRNGEIVTSESWMSNPDPQVYTSWHEFAKQLFWDYQLGEAFVLPMAHFSDGWPMNFRVVPPWLMHVEMRGGKREYRLGGAGGVDVTQDVLHIRYKSTTDSPHGVGPLESAGGRMLTAGVLAKYVREVAQTKGEAGQTLETDQELDPDSALDLARAWVESRSGVAHPPVLDRNLKLVDHKVMSPKDMALLEIAQFTEARISELLGVPAFLVGLPSGDSLTYSNVSSLFDYHDRSSLRPKAAHVMSALSGWALPRGQAAELNRDEYSRPAFNERADALVKLVEAGIMSKEEARLSERLVGEAPTTALTGGNLQ